MALLPAQHDGRRWRHRRLALFRQRRLTNPNPNPSPNPNPNPTLTLTLTLTRQRRLPVPDGIVRADTQGVHTRLRRGDALCDESRHPLTPRHLLHRGAVPGY